MIADDGEAIVMDLGSATKARVAIHDRREAIAQQVRENFLLFLFELPA